MKTILFLLQIDTAKVANVKTSNSLWTSMWFWFALAEFVVIVFLLLRKNNKTNLTFSDLEKNAIKSSKTTNIDMENLMNSINSSGELYKNLSRKCHPDRFVNSPKQKIAEEIFQEISMNKRDFEKLSSLKQRAINELNLNFDK